MGTGVFLSIHTSTHDQTPLERARAQKGRKYVLIVMLVLACAVQVFGLAGFEILQALYLFDIFGTASGMKPKRSTDMRPQTIDKCFAVSFPVVAGNFSESSDVEYRKVAKRHDIELLWSLIP
jgi:hypothetical protein